MSKDLNTQIIRRCLDAVKVQLKSRQLTYQDIAALFDVSENTVKRMLNQDDISLDRLLTLSQLCGIDTAELLSKSQQHRTAHTYFSARQDQAFAENPHLLSYFSRLFYQQHSVEKIACEFGLSDLSSYRYLRALEDIELLELKPQNKFRFLVSPPLGFAPDSMVIKQSACRHMEQTLEAVMAPHKTPQHHVVIKPLKMPAILHDKMWQELQHTLSKYAQVAEMAFAEYSEQPNIQVTLVTHPLNSNLFDEAPIISLD
ncbi:helix-turn-helix domain-containing protein [Pseudoalteromonas sp. R3]|uniref:helix-turn-helix domain-containing protein n=1 Tax=Pseudoalteromonas sp. R3 TaxID=1709477 RepID=UPI0006B637F4|nr:helix-turn-helix domain-containing protein [Pseudoalteromonas sp. R3]AZZ98151.1 XRE family transcriptional regulator [Pseudoalteromonas sp. R3]